MPAKPYHKDFRFKSRNGVYYVIYRFRPERPLSTGQRTEEDAVVWAYAHMDDKPGGNIMLKEFAKDFFLPGKCTWSTRMLAKGRTYHGKYFPEQRRRLENYILPRFGPLLVSAIGVKEIDEWLMSLRNYKTGEPLASQTRRKILIAFRQILGEAKYQKVINDNPAAEVDLYIAGGAEREPFSVAELHLLFPEDIDALLPIWKSLSWAVYFYIMASCGLRPGEASALRWGDWNRALHGAIIARSVEGKTSRIKGLKTAKKGLSKKPATFTSRAEQLLLMLESQTENSDPDSLIFQRHNGGPILYDSGNRHFKASCRRAGVYPRGRSQYCLRHTYNTHLLNLASVKQVQMMMGHLSLQSSIQYDHPTEENLLEQAGAMREMVENVFDYEEEQD